MARSVACCACCNANLSLGGGAARVLDVFPCDRVKPLEVHDLFVQSGQPLESSQEREVEARLHRPLPE